MTMMQSVLVYEEPRPRYRERLITTGLTDLLGGLNYRLVRAPQPSWLPRIDGRLRELQSLTRGWDGYDAPPISGAVLSFARSVLESIMTAQCPPPSLVPTHGGGLQLEWHLAGGDVELMIYRPAEASLTAFYADGTEPIEEEPLSSDFQRLSDVLSKIA